MYHQIEFLDEYLKKSTCIDAIKCQILLLEKTFHELIFWIKMIENEEDIAHAMVSILCHLHDVTKICANINNTDQNFLEISNKNLFYDDDDDKHLPIPVYSVIKPSMGTEHILNNLLSQGRFSTERKIILQMTL